MIKFLDLEAQYQSIKGDIDSAIAETIATSAFVGGAPVKAFEADFAAWLGGDVHCVGVANGTDALEIALEALDLRPGSDVIVPANSFIASGEAVVRTGHRVVFADVDPGHYNLTAETVRAKLTPETKVIIAVHLYGHPCDMEALGTLAAEHGLKVIEDCAQAHGATAYDRMIGTIGDIACFSFYPGKNLGAYGDAGAIVTRDAALADRSRKIANHGRIAKYDHEFIGRNSRLDGLQAAILSAKLPHLRGWTDQRIALAERYLAELSNMPGLVLPLRAEWARQVYHLFVVRSDERDALRDHLAQCGIQTGIHYPTALPRLQAFASVGQADEDSFANRSDRTLLSLPIGEHLTVDDVSIICQAILAFNG